jgi:hypothetical protein
VEGRHLWTFEGVPEHFYQSGFLRWKQIGWNRGLNRPYVLQDIGTVFYVLGKGNFALGKRRQASYEQDKANLLKDAASLISSNLEEGNK